MSRRLLRKLERVRLDSVEPYPDNPRRADLPAIVESLRQNEQFEPIVVQASTRYVLVGNHRVLAARELGWDVVDAVVVDVDDDHARRIALASNRIAELGGYDDDLLAAQLAALSSYEGTGYVEQDIEDLAARLAALHGSANPDPGPQEPPAEPKSKLGEVYELGRHRVMCGDSTEPDQVAVLLDGAEPFLMTTDPPYGVSYDPTWREEHRQGLGDHRLGAVANDDRIDWTDAYALFPGAVAYVWRAAFYAGDVARHLAAVGFDLRAEVIWVKPYAVMSRGHFNWQHEGCWYAVRKGESARWAGEPMTPTVWEETPPNEPYKAHADREDAITYHGTQKPLGLFRRAIELHDRVGGHVYDPFCGSGTAVIAAEQSSRRCLAMEIEPGYVDAIRRRYASFVGDESFAP